MLEVHRRTAYKWMYDYFKRKKIPDVTHNEKIAGTTLLFKQQPTVAPEISSSEKSNK